MEYMQDIQVCEPFVIMESSSQDYSSTVVLLRNLAEKKDITSLERKALAIAIKLIQSNIEPKKS
ncbi:hypothetical protein ANME2D_01559 [Candidatus Methanoperedens nitroreducens]|uniref:Uncharacterized protein n=1 Tax=Candidatus Methanoperedens nitratireducens TaxID=1392998 RepID=A0A062V9Y1_9EURY|nr:hypothetical protein [Candidatus Methanoperedens nitroreducens]KCZ72155.1 hypothetical protein ANME2D_01559 [Candidatus Methanoperedens nitroreducens]MDJ1421868.1 hypothetical protein [Candidatus Methanoperedens sp.]